MASDEHAEGLEAEPGDSVAGGDGVVAEGFEEHRFAGARRDSDRLQQLRAVLPCEVRVTSATHPLFGRLLAASGFCRRGGLLLLVVGLPDGSPGTIPAIATDVLGGSPVVAGSTVLTVEGLRRVRQLVVAMAPPAQRRSRAKARK